MGLRRWPLPQGCLPAARRASTPWRKRSHQRSSLKSTSAIESGELHGTKPLSLFDPLWVGLPVTVAGVLFMIFVGTRLLPGGRQHTAAAGPHRLFRAEFRVERGSDLDGKTLEDAGFDKPSGYQLLAVTRKGQPMTIAAALKLEGDDLLAMAGPSDEVAALWAVIGLIPAYGNLTQKGRYLDQLVEVVAAPEVPAVGHLVSEIPLPDSPYQLRVVGVSHGGQAPDAPLRDYRVQANDAAVLEVPDAFFYENRREADFVLVKSVEGYEVKRVSRAVIALVITVAMMAVTAFNLTTMLNAALLATAAMLATGCLTPRRIWDSLDWSTVVVLGAAVGLEGALTGRSATLSPIVGRHRREQPHGGPGRRVLRGRSWRVGNLATARGRPVAGALPGGFVPACATCTPRTSQGGSQHANEDTDVGVRRARRSHGRTSGGRRCAPRRGGRQGQGRNEVRARLFLCSLRRLAPDDVPPLDRRANRTSASRSWSCSVWSCRRKSPKSW